MSKPKIYFGCTITGNEHMRSDKLGAVIKMLSQKFEVILPQLNTSSACFEDDLKLIDEADATLFYIGSPSTGMGMEMYHCKMDIYSYAWAFPCDTISPFVEGFCESYDVPIFYDLSRLRTELEEDLL